MATIGVSVQNALRVPTSGPGAIDITLMAWVENFKVCNPIPPNPTANQNLYNRFAPGGSSGTAATYLSTMTLPTTITAHPQVRLIDAVPGDGMLNPDELARVREERSLKNRPQQDDPTTDPEPLEPQPLKTTATPQVKLGTSSGGGANLSVVSSLDSNLAAKSAKQTFGAIGKLFSGDFKEAGSEMTDAFANGIGFLAGMIPMMLDRPTDAYYEQTHAITSNFPINYNKGAYPGVRMSENPKGSHMVHPDFTGRITTSLSKADYQQRFSFLCTVTVTTAVVANTIVYDTWLNPMLTPVHAIIYGRNSQTYRYALNEVLGNAVEDPHNCFVPTYLHAYTKQDQFWRGSILIRFEAISSNFQNCTLEISFYPGSTTRGNNATDPMQTHTAVFKLGKSSTKQVTYRCPYQTGVPYLNVHSRNNALRPDSDGQPGFVFIGDTYMMKTVSGRFTIQVKQRLTTTDAAPNSFDFNLYIAGGPDFASQTPYVTDNRTPYLSVITDDENQPISEIRTMQTVLMATPPKDTPTQAFIDKHTPLRKGISTSLTTMFKPTARPQVGEGDRAKLATEPIEEVNLGLDQNALVPAEFGLMHGELFADIRNYCRISKRIMALRYTITPGDATSGFTMTIPVRPFLAEQSAPTWLAYFSTMYATWSGDIRFFLMCSTSKNYSLSATVTHYPFESQEVISIDNTYSVVHSELGLTTNISNISAQPYISISVPWKQQVAVLPTFFTATDRTWDDVNSNGIVRIHFTVSETDSTNHEIYFQLFQSGGDDFRFHTSLPPPPYIADLEADAVLIEYCP